MTEISAAIVYDFKKSFEAIQGAVHINAVNHGWWDEPEWKAEARRLLTENTNYDEGHDFKDAADACIAAIPDFNDGEKLALMTSELSEVLEGLRGDNKSDKLPGFSSEEEELADVVIRIMDYAGKKKLRVAEAIIEKAKYNLSRPYKHGKKF